MKITDINITDKSVLLITTDEPVTNLVRVYMDMLDNIDNMYSEVIEDHSFYTRTFTVTDKTINVDISEFALDRSAFVVSIEEIHDGVTRNCRRFFYDDEELFYGEVSMLDSFYNTCLDK